MSTVVRLVLFATVAIAQLVIPAQMIWSRESVLHNGTLYRFRTAPVDPYDAFRGRYVWLSLEENSAPIPKGELPTPGETVYAVLGTDDDGVAHITEVRVEPPAQGDYIRGTAGWVDEFDHRIHVDLPIDRYYMEEWQAPEAERVYREHSGTTTKDAYVTVRVYQGEAVVEGLLIGDVPIEQYLLQQSETRGGNES